MSDHDQWLEQPYIDAATATEADAVAQERGFRDAEEYEQALEDERGDILYERKREREMFGDDS